MVVGFDVLLRRLYSEQNQWRSQPGDTTQANCTATVVTRQRCQTVQILLHLKKDLTGTPQAKAPLAWGLATPLDVSNSFGIKQYSHNSIARLPEEPEP